MKTDFHSHFLPGIDDGAKTPGQSVGILQYLKNNGIDCVCATPHFAKHDERVSSFLDRRADAVRRLDDFIDSSGIDRQTLPEIVLGAEVHLYRNLSERDRLDQLCYEGTRWILLELPFRKFEGWELEEVYNIMYQLKVNPVMAHINRYTEYYSKSEFSDMFYNGDFALQINCESANTFSGSSLIKKVAKSGFDTVFGCDIHDPDKTDESGLERTEKILAKLPHDRLYELEEFERSVLNR